MKQERDTIDKKIIDLEDEILIKNKEIQDFNQKLEKNSTSNSKSSLKEELESDQCDTNLVTSEEFKTHNEKRTWKQVFEESRTPSKDAIIARNHFKTKRQFDVINPQVKNWRIQQKS